MRPILNQLLVKPFLADNVSEGGVIVPDSFRGLSHKCVVVATGKGTKAKPMNVKEGVIAYRVKDSGMELEINGEKHLIMDMDNILAYES